MKIPDKTYQRIKDKLWGLADDLNWPTLSNPQKSALFEDWLRDDQIGGVLSRYLDTGSVRVYLKDTIMKPYARERIKDFPTRSEAPGDSRQFFRRGNLYQASRGTPDRWKGYLLGFFEGLENHFIRRF